MNQLLSPKNSLVSTSDFLKAEQMVENALALRRRESVPQLPRTRWEVSRVWWPHALHEGFFSDPIFGMQQKHSKRDKEVKFFQ